MVGQELICDTSVQQMKDGGSITWINAFQVNGEPTKSNVAPKSNGASSISASIDLPLPFISNTVATAISAGLIKKPEDIESWVVGCHRAVTYLNEKDISGAVKEVSDSLKQQGECNVESPLTNGECQSILNEVDDKMVSDKLEEKVIQSPLN